MEVIDCFNGKKIQLMSNPDSGSACDNCIFRGIDCDLVPLIGGKCCDVVGGYWIELNDSRNY